MDDLREEIRTNQEMTEAQKEQANAEIDKLERDKQKFLVAMTAVTVMTTSLVATASAPLMISAILAGYSAIAPYFWEHRIGLIKGCDPIENVFSDENEHNGNWIQLDSDYLYYDQFWRIDYYKISQSGYYYLSAPKTPLIYIGIGDDAESVIDPIDVTICLHGYSGSISVYNGSTIHIRDCKYKEDENGDVVGGGTLSGVEMADRGQLIIDRVNVSGSIRSYGSEVIINGGTITRSGNNTIAISSQNGGNITINEAAINVGGVLAQGGGNITVNEAIINAGGVLAQDGGNITINGGAVLGYADVHDIDRNAFARSCGMWTDSGKITVNNSETSMIATETGEITIYNGQIGTTSLGISNYNGTVHVFDGTIKGIQNEKGTVNVSGGTIAYYSSGISNGTDGTVNITGGVISSTQGNGISNKGVLNISGGLITGDRGCVENDNGKVTIFDGTLDGRDDGSIASTIQTKGTDSVVTIKGGMFYGNVNPANDSGAVIISNGAFYRTIDNYHQKVTLLINKDTDIKLGYGGDPAFAYSIYRDDYYKPPYVKYDTDYSGGIIYYNSKSESGTPITIEQAAAIDYTQPYIRIKAADNGGNPGTYTLTVNASPTAGGSVSGGGTYDEGETVVVTATANSGYRFVRWMENRATVCTSTIYTFIAEADRTLTAVFEQISDYSGSSDSNIDYEPYEPLYKNTVPDRITGGTVNVLPTSASEGQRVTITVKPYAGYELDTLTITDSKGNILTLTDQGDGKYTFIMPDSKVNIDVSFKSIVPPINFSDVPRTAYYYDAVTWAVSNGITYGVTDTAFGPDVACTRAQIVSFLWRQAGSPKMDGDNPFTDVSASDYYYDAVLWAVANGITYGSSDTTFSPSDVCTRAQAMTFLYRDRKSPAISGTGGFTDVPAGEYYADAVQWAVFNGVTAGTTTTTFSPAQDCTRAQIVSFLYRARVN